MKKYLLFFLDDASYELIKLFSLITKCTVGSSHSVMWIPVAAQMSQHQLTPQSKFGSYDSHRIWRL